MSTERANPRLEVQALSGAEEVALVGFTTYSGTVTAASGWDAPAERKRVRPALPDSHEALFHEAGEPRFLVDLLHGQTAEILRRPRLERSAGWELGEPPETYPTAL